jgi:uncharacterized protein (DUF2235 family)
MTRAEFIQGSVTVALAAVASGCVAQFRPPLPGSPGPSGGTWVREPSVRDRSPKNIVICFDGSWNRPGKQDEGTPVETNVARFYSAVTNAYAYYAPGVGTHPLDRYWGGLFGLGLATKIKQAYAFLVQHHQPADRIFLMGFSRGAFAARSLAGMISWCGIVPQERLREEPGLTEQAWAAYWYRRDNPTLRFKQPTWASSMEMIGVWDTVEALGSPIHDNRAEDFFGYHDVNFTHGLNSAYHALAIDEHRANFKLVPWPANRPEIEEVWFAGAHGDVGGGYPDHGLANIALRWMIGRAERHGLAFDSESICNLRPDPNATLHDSHTGVYKKRKGIDRKIEEGSLIHWSVGERYARNSDYRPRNLAGCSPGASESLRCYRIAEDDGSPARCASPA